MRYVVLAAIVVLALLYLLSQQPAPPPDMSQVTPMIGEPLLLPYP